MSFRKPVVILVLCSLSFGSFLGVKSIPMKQPDGYAVLTVDASYPDRFIRDLIPMQGVISESGQWVFLDNFGDLEQVPLDEYDNRLEDFDPRRDGYAEKLRSFFVHEGKRLFFIPFSGDSLEKWIEKLGCNKPDWGTIPVSDSWINKKQAARLETSLAASLGDIPFSIEFFRHEQPLLRYFFLFILAAAGALVLSDTPLFTAALVPVLGSLVFAGPAGLALSTVLLGLSGIVMRTFQWKGTSLLEGFLCLIMLGLWLKMFWDMPGVFSSAGEGMIGLSDRKTLEIMGIPALVCSLLVPALWITPQSQGVSLPTFGNRRSYNGTIIPFVLVSLMSLTGESRTYPGQTGDPRYFIDTAEYESHLNFQRFFSFTPLGSSRTEPDYVEYIVGEDGLIAKPGEQYLHVENNAIPPFPLESLIAFLRDFRYTAGQNTIPMIGLVLILLLMDVYSDSTAEKEKTIISI